LNGSDDAEKMSVLNALTVLRDLRRMAGTVESQLDSEASASLVSRGGANSVPYNRELCRFLSFVSGMEVFSASMVWRRRLQDLLFCHLH
jgi:hypothetical protein